MDLPRGAKVTHAGLLQHNVDGSTELQKITQAGLVARSPEGTAAKGMNIRGNEDLWVEIQANTFRNWVNECIRDSGFQVSDMATDFCDGTLLCLLVEALQKRALKPSWNKNPNNQHHYLENATKALNAIEADGIKLVNIGNVDIVNGNVKLILGLIWSLIVRYQIGRSKFPPRKLMLAWLQAALPECRVTNLTTDWNTGVLLSALLDYCEPGLFPHWRSLDPNQSIKNCERAMNIAQRELGVPKVLEPEYLASPWLDELSGMTYLSYFMKPDGPGYNATLQWVNSQVRRPVSNFTTDWVDGRTFCEIIKGLGGNCPAPEKLSRDPEAYESNLRKAVEAGKRLGVNPILSPKEMADPDVEHLGIMSYATNLRWVNPRPPLADMLRVNLESTSGRIGQPTYFKIDILSPDIDMSQVKAFIDPPHSEVLYQVKVDRNGEGMYIPEKYGMHEIILQVGEDQLGGHFFRVYPAIPYVAPPGMTPCAIGSIVEVLVYATGAPKTEDILVTAYSPTGRKHRCELTKVEEGHSAIFKPDEAGLWEIAITYQGNHIQESPYTCSVFDPNGVTVHGLDGAMPFKAHAFEVDCRGTGVHGELHVDITHDKKSLVCAVEQLVTENKYQVTFMPRAHGKHRVYIYYNGYDVKGSPYILRVGTKGRSGKTRPSPGHDHRVRSESPSVIYNSHNSTQNRSSELYSTRRDYSSPSRQSPARMDRIGSPRRDLYSPTRNESEREVYSHKYKETKKTYRSSPDIVYGSNRDDVDYVTRSQLKKSFSPIPRIEEPIYATRVTSPSPVRNIAGSTLRNSPLTFSSTKHYESTTRNISSSPRLVTSSPSLVRPSPVNFTSSKYETERTSSPMRTSGGVESSTQRIRKETKIYQSSSNHVDNSFRSSPLTTTTGLRPTSPEAIGYTSTSTSSSKVTNNNNINNSSSKTGSRRDSWDVLNKTKGILSPNSLESLANLTETQLNTDLVDNVTQRNTKYNKFLLNDRANYTSSSTVKEERYVSKQEGTNNFSLSNGAGSRFKPITDTSKDVSGARAIKVQDIPDGVLGRPVEFEIDGSRAGSGNLEILVNGGRVTSSVRALGGQKFIASFTPHESGTHVVQITFNGESVPGSPWTIEIMGSPGFTTLGESTRLVARNSPAVFEVLPPPGSTLNRGECVATVLSPSKSKVNARVTHEAANGAMRIEFVPTEVGTHIIEAHIGATKLVGGPLIAKVYDASLIQVSDVNGGVVGQPCQFKVDASAAGEGQLEISINEGEVPNHVQVVGGGRCLVSFTPESAKPHYIDIKFNSEAVPGCPFICSVADTSRVLLNLSNLELVPVNKAASFHISVSGGGAAELAVSVRGPHGELPVRVTGDIHLGFTAEFTPVNVGAHTISVDYNSFPVQGTPFIAKAYDAGKVTVGAVTKGQIGRPVQFTVDAGEAGEGNLEITISAKGHNIPTQVHPQGNARFAVSFVPNEPCEHIISISFNKIAVPGTPIAVSISGGTSGPQVSLNGPGAVHQPNSFMINHSGGRLDDIEVNVEGPTGHALPSQVYQTDNGVFRAEFVPRMVGEHKVAVMVRGQPTAGSPYSAKVYDVSAIKVKNVATGTVGKPVTFLVETSQAGPGNLEVTVNGGRVPTSAQAQGQHTYAISFTPRDAQNHIIELRFNGQQVPGSPFTCKINAAARIITSDIQDKVSVGKTFEFVVESDTRPVVEVLGPARRSVPTNIIPVGSGFRLSFEPVEVGDHSIEVRLPQSGHVEGSPFLLKAYSAEKVIVTDIRPGTVGKSVTFGINASQAGAGNLEIIVAVGGKNVPNFVQSEGNARFKVNFKPNEAAVHSISIRFNGHSVPGSPFNCPVSPAPMSLSKALVTGEYLRQAPVNRDNVIELTGFDGIQPQVTVYSSTGDVLPSRVLPRGEGFIATFRPVVVGRHQIHVTSGDQHIPSSPLQCNVYDVNRVQISGLEQSNGPAAIGLPLTFSVDAAGAGEGTLELVVQTETATVKAEVVAVARGLYDVTFVPQSCERHFINITFNDQGVPGSPFRVEVQKTVQNVQVGGVGAIEYYDNNNILEIIGPDQTSIPYTLSRRFAEFRAIEIGSYVVRCLDRETRQVVSTLRTVNVFDPTRVKIVEVSEAYCNRPAHLTLSTDDAGQGSITAIVRCGVIEVPHSIRGSDNIYEIVYHPTRVAPHKINILYNNVPISKPIEINVLPLNAGKEISVSGLGLYQGRVGKTTSFSIDTIGRPAREFDVVISGAEGEALPVRCYQTKGGHLQAEFTIQKIGQCMIEVLHQSKSLPGSPFTCESYDPAKVMIQGAPKGHLAVHSPVSFTLNTQEAGMAELDAVLLSGHGQQYPVSVVQKNETTYLIEFVPNAPGHYKMMILYGGEPIPTSPITFAVSSTGAKTNDPRASGNGLEVAHRGKEASFVVYCSTSPNVQIERYDEQGERIEPKIKSLGHNEWKIIYNILSVGKYEIRASCPNRGPLPGSPWHISCVDSSKVVPVGGWGPLLDDDGRLILPARIIFDTSEAGPGELICLIDDREIPIDKHSDNRSRIYISGEGLQSGEHSFELTFSGVTVSQSPGTAFVTPLQAADKVVLTGRGLAAAQCGEPAHFTIDASQAPPGRPEVILTYFDGESVPVALTQPRITESIWLASYTPIRAGNLNLSVKWSGRLVKGCPLSVAVGSAADASKVLCSGEGLRHGVVGREIKSWIDTRRAGPGELTAHCSGPRKVAYCELYDHGDATFTLNIKPQEPGRHNLVIKYAGNHVPGSPFQLRIAGAPDASKVRVYGPGIQHGVLATFQSRFICDTRGAGAGQLTVRVRGPKGAFRVEMQRESQKDRTILCKYDPTEPGDYRVEVKWAGELVPGSPFQVMIFDTEEELRRFLNGNLP